jgi:hypothetical protein
MPKPKHTDMRFNNPRYYDSAGNSTDIDGNILLMIDQEGWFALKRAMKKMEECTNIRQVREILAGLKMPKEFK